MATKDKINMLWDRISCGVPDARLAQDYGLEVARSALSGVIYTRWVLSLFFLSLGHMFGTLIISTWGQREYIEKKAS